MSRLKKLKYKKGDIVVFCDDIVRIKKISITAQRNLINNKKLKPDIFYIGEVILTLKESLFFHHCRCIPDYCSNHMKIAKDSDYKKFLAAMIKAHMIQNSLKDLENI